MKNTIFKLAELFCGPGGLSLGLISAKVKDNTGKEYEIKGRPFQAQYAQSLWSEIIANSDVCAGFNHGVF